jgi:uncharacterized membrane protein YczE
MRKVTPPAVCQARTLPIVWPLALTSGIGGPPCGSGTVLQAASIGVQARMIRKLRIRPSYFVMLNWFQHPFL